MSDASVSDSETLLGVRDLARHYVVRRGRGWIVKPTILRAVDGVSFDLKRGRTLGLVGESGCGKSTTAKLVLGLVTPTAGEVRFEGAPVPAPGTAAWRASRRRMQMVYQDPLGALDRRLTVGRQIMEPLVIHGGTTAAERRERAMALLDAVGLKPHQFDSYPHELSGGQRQRIVLARALILEPSLLVCDEPVSALDVSIQAQVVNLLLELQARFNLTYLFISHDLRVVRHVSHEVAVMYLGRIVEQGDPDRLMLDPAHPYTRALVSAIPAASARRGRPRLVLSGDPPNPMDIPSGCAFHTRCPLAVARCRAERPPLRPHPDGRLVACHLAPGDAGAAAAA
jgi:peptide/nickel transport system ATP-binding protein